jgi:hypothetical protein
LASASITQALWKQHGERASDDAGQGEVTAGGEGDTVAGEDPEAAWRRRRAVQQDVSAAVRLGGALEKLTAAEDALLSAWEGVDSGMAGAVADQGGVEENEPEHVEALLEQLHELESQASTAARGATDSARPAWASRLAASLQFRDTSVKAIQQWRDFRLSGAFLRLRGRPGIVEMTS